jgi:hypothetical protein
MLIRQSRIVLVPVTLKNDGYCPKSSKSDDRQSALLSVIPAEAGIQAMELKPTK